MRRIWVDTDIALGTPSGDVDDGFALAAIARAAGRGEVELVGVSAVSGNTDARSAEQAARRLLAVSGNVEVPVVSERSAPSAIAALGEIDLLAIGPPTNLVEAAMIDPALPSRVTVRAVGTVIDRLRHPLLPLFCLNFGRRPEIAQRFFALPWKRAIMFPLDVVRRLWADADRLRAIRESELGAYLEEGSRRWLTRAIFRHGRRRFPVWDLPAALDLLGALPEAAFEPFGARERLMSFDPEQAWDRFDRLLSRS